ncbi:Heterokaryon incompatibility [Niveomyces insectorum RCEF 264]|uniref:Heterokaryon incompatibility n=1 Tax=Niveomyces insectorum RCEF 264 TaxID=1081102 RepID=A0A168ACG7_9HYPO|nr:Heterokaryon incompatibility [Niveomyces insectorum RCEF 264]
MAPTARTLYQDLAGDDTVVQLGSLCPTCQRFKEASSLLARWSGGEDLPSGATEKYDLCSPEQLRNGYLGGCHLCALLWVRAGGVLFDPDEPVLVLKLNRVVVQLEARDLDQDYHTKPSGGQVSQTWMTGSTPNIGEGGVVVMWLPVVYEYQSRYPNQDHSSWHDIYIYFASNPTLNQHMIRAPLGQPISTRNVQRLDQLHAWYRSCVKNHGKCNTFSRFVAPANLLPSRLLDLQGDKVRLECAVAEHLPLDVEYSTLSHMWGPDPSAVLTLVQANLAAFQVEIPGALLPDKYTEAIRLARGLGFRYLWIDSLCIIQDSTEDWEREAVKMAAVYGRSRCNISYAYPPEAPRVAASTSSPDEKKHLRDPRLYLPCRLQYAQDGHHDLVVQDAPAGLESHWSSKTFMRRWPLLSRAWVFQERLLCPRTVYCGDSRLIWECCETQQDEFYGAVPFSPRSKPHFYPVFSGIIKDYPHPDLDDGSLHDPTFQIEWPLLVQDYRCGDLTYEKDRSMAFAGIARAIQTHTSLTYLAGAWKELADTSLLWTVCQPAPAQVDEFRKNLKALQGQPNLPPSWSWFSVPPFRLAPGSDVLDFQTCSVLVDPRCAPVQVGGRRFRARVVDFHHPKLATNPDALLHDFHGLRITLRTRRISAVLVWETVWGKDRLELHASGAPTNRFVYAHDDVLLTPGSPSPGDVCMLLTLLQTWNEVDNEGDDNDKAGAGSDGYGNGKPKMKSIWQYAGLAVIPAGTIPTGDVCWRRIGVFSCFNEVPGENQIVVTPFDVDHCKDEDVVLV